MSSSEAVSNVKLFSSNTKLYEDILSDIQGAKHSIYVEIYRITKETVGKTFRDALCEAAKRGVKVFLLIDAWGTGHSLSFFEPLIKNGGNVKVFNTFRLGTRVLTQSHRRNHRKIIIIDDEICYLGSSNITNYSASWRELMIRIKGTIAKPFKHIFEINFKHHRKYSYNQKVFTRVINFLGFEIIRDIPSIYKQVVMTKYLHLISNARKSVYIETPYFLPGYRLRKSMADAAERGVNVTAVMPKHSDVVLADLLRNYYLGKTYKSGVNIRFYYPDNLHSKLLLIDDSYFCVGSSNFDYRSFRNMHEVMLAGENPLLLTELLNHKEETLKNTEEFNYEGWKKRAVTEKMIEHILVPLRYFF